jgi:phage shock protein E
MRLTVLGLFLAAAPLLEACSGGTPPAPTPASAAAPSTHVDGAQARELVKKGAHLVDVRTPEEYAAKHVDGAQNVPVDVVDKADLGPKDTPLVVYCQSGRRAARAVEVLRAKGYTNVSDLGAMSNWEK